MRCSIIRRIFQSCVRYLTITLCLLFAGLCSGQTQAQYVWDDQKMLEIPQHMTNFQKWLDDMIKPHEEYLQKLESGYFDPRPGAMIRPRPGSQNPQGKLLAAFRLGPIENFEVAELNGVPASQKQVLESKLIREGSLLEFYEDGTFLRVRNGHIARPDSFGTCRGTYTHNGNRIEFRAYATGTGPYQSMNESVRGVIVFEPNGVAHAEINEELQNFGSVSHRGQLLNQWNNRFRLGYAVRLTPETPGQLAAVNSPPVRISPALLPAPAPLVGKWYRTCVLPDGRNGLEGLWLKPDGSYCFLLTVDEGKQVVHRSAGKFELTETTLRLIQENGQTFIVGRVQIINGQGFSLTYPNGTRHQWLLMPREYQ